VNSFISPKEEALTKKFLRQGYLIECAESPKDLEKIKNLVFEVDMEENLNQQKLAVMAALTNASWTHLAYFNLARNLLYTLVGNELAMQKKFNLNIQLPGDKSSLLPVHADTWTGDSPYQLVLWVPLTDCYRTKSMFLLPPNEPYTLAGSSEDVWNSIKDRVKWLEVKYGEVLIFNSTLPHGNRVNEEATARWTVNCRFKSVHSPWGVKGPGEHFEPITLRAASTIGMTYQHPAV